MALMLCITFFFLQSFQTLISAEAEFPCFFIFGDSFVDNGNNNYLDTVFKVDYLPYGIDFPAGPTGRFNNGRNIADIMAKKLGFENSIPPFANGTTQDILGGLNYGSGGAGILNETGILFGHLLSLGEQLSNHEITISRIKELLQEEDAVEEHLRSCLYYVGIGTNDYILNYLPLFYTSLTDYTPKQFASHLITNYSTMLRRLYRNGARKVAVAELGKLGCMPVVTALFGSTNSSSCDETSNDVVQIFNEDLKLLLDNLNHDYPRAKFVHLRDLALTPSTGDNIKIENGTCCVPGIVGLCAEGSDPCSNRDEYRFWDPVHPTEAAVVAASDTTYNDISPLLSHDPFTQLDILEEMCTTTKKKLDNNSEKDVVD